MLDEIRQIVAQLRKKMQDLKGFLGIVAKKQEIEALEARMSGQDFWNDQDMANRVVRQLKYLKSCVDPYEKNLAKLDDLDELGEISQEDKESLEMILEDAKALEKDIDVLETQAFLSGKFDRNNVILSINAGAGGTESCDWSNMLLRMYTPLVRRQ